MKRRLLYFMAVLITAVGVPYAMAVTGVGFSSWNKLVGTLSDGDYLAITDVSDHSESDNGSSKAITASQLKSYILSPWLLPTDSPPSAGQTRILYTDSTGQLHADLDPAPFLTDDQTAAEVTLNVTAFDHNLTSADNTVQKALNTLDDLVAAGGTDSQTADQVPVNSSLFSGTLSQSDDNVQKALTTLDALNITGTDSQTAAQVPVTATGFTKNLSSADDTVQKALTTLDQMTAGGMTDIVADTTPQLGGNLDLNGYNLGSVTPTVMGYLVGITSGVQSQINTKQTGSLNLSDWSNITTSSKQNTDSDLTAIAALATQAFGRSLLTGANAAAVDALIGLGPTNDVAFNTLSVNSITSSAADGEHYVDAVNTVSPNLTLAQVAGRLSYYNGKMRIANGSDWNGFLLTNAELVDTPTNGDVTHAPTNNALFDGLATKANTGEVKSSATTGVMTITGPAAGTNRVMTIPDANFTVLSTSALGTGVQTALGVAVNNAGAFARLLAKGSATVDLTSIASGTCAVAVDVSSGLTGVTSSDNLLWDFGGDPTSIVGFQPSSNGMLTVIPYLGTAAIAIKFCNNTSSAIDPGSVVINWRVIE
jgi:hypothetical protein